MSDDEVNLVELARTIRQDWAQATCPVCGDTLLSRFYEGGGTRCRNYARCGYWFCY